MKRFIVAMVVAVALFVSTNQASAHPRVVVVPSYGGAFVPAPVVPVYRPVFVQPAPVFPTPIVSPYYGGGFVRPGFSSYGVNVVPGYGVGFSYSRFGYGPGFGYSGFYSGW